MHQSEIAGLIETIEVMRKKMPAEQAMLAGISGIDASGKGYVSNKLDEALRLGGYRTALVNVDAWLNLPHIRFSSVHPALHFYENAIRLEEMFERLILPLRDNRCVRLDAKLIRETESEHHEYTYSFENIDIVIVEGIFLFKPRSTRHFDLKVWIDCSFRTALERALARAQEGLDPAATVSAYETIYFPAQLIHLERDHPRSAADLILQND